MGLFRPGGDTAASDSIERQLGEITGTLNAFRDDLGELKAGFVAISRAQGASSDDRRRQQQILISRIEAIERTASSQHASNTEKLTSLSTELVAMKEPVSQFVSLRRSILYFGVLASGLAGMAWTLAAPIYNYMVAHVFTK